MVKKAPGNKHVTCAVCKAPTSWKAVTRGAPAVAITAEQVAAADSGAAADPLLAAVRAFTFADGDRLGNGVSPLTQA